MVCEHLRQLYQLCQDQKLRLSGSDLIHIVCEQCGRKEVCPSNLRVDRDDDLADVGDAIIHADAAHAKDASI